MVYYMITLPLVDELTIDKENKSIEFHENFTGRLVNSADNCLIPVLSIVLKHIYDIVCCEGI